MTSPVVSKPKGAEVMFNSSRSCTCEDPSLVEDGSSDVALKETAPRHTLLEGGDTPGENIDVVGEIRALSVECRPEEN